MTRLFLSLLFGCMLWSSASAATTFFSQSACPGQGGGQPGDVPSGFCLSFDHDDSIPIVRSLSFPLGAARQVMVQFNGTMLCQSVVDQDLIIHLASQIVTGAAVVPNAFGPGGALIRTALHDQAAPESDLQDQFMYNLASSRLITYPTGGTVTVHFKINRVFMNPGPVCYVYNPVLTVIRP